MSWKDNVYNVNAVDAQQMAREYPDTFSAPSLKELNNLKIGDIVKISNKEERFWVEIISIKGNKIKGRVNNELVGSSRYGYDDIISFDKKEIYTIFRG